LNESRYSVLDDGSVIFRYTDAREEPPFEVRVLCPLTSKLHERHAEIQEQHRHWAKAFDLAPSERIYRNYCDTRLDLLASYQLYDLPLEAAVIHSHLMTWFFFFDDTMDIDHGLEGEARSYTSRLCTRHLEILDNALPEDSDPGCIHAFYDFLKKVMQLGAGQQAYWFERMKHHLREYVLGAHWENLIGPTTDKNANTALYLQVRHMAVGVSPCLDLMALAAGVPGKPLVENFFIQRLERLAINYSIWVNDLAGLGRDMMRGLGNVIFTLQRDHGLSLTEATRMAARMCDAELAAFLEVERQLPMLLGADYDKDKTAYDAYAGVLKRWMRGLLDWSARTDRYQRLDVDMALQNDTLIRQASRKHLPD
jgi:hypothetical protein